MIHFFFTNHVFSRSWQSLVGTMKAARKRGLIDFEGQMLLQVRRVINYSLMTALDVHFLLFFQVALEPLYRFQRPDASPCLRDPCWFWSCTIIDVIYYGVVSLLLSSLHWSFEPPPSLFFEASSIRFPWSPWLSTIWIWSHSLSSLLFFGILGYSSPPSIYSPRSPWLSFLEWSAIWWNALLGCLVHHCWILLLSCMCLPCSIKSSVVASHGLR